MRLDGMFTNLGARKALQTMEIVDPLCIRPEGSQDEAFCEAEVQALGSDHVHVLVRFQCLYDDVFRRQKDTPELLSATERVAITVSHENKRLWGWVIAAREYLKRRRQIDRWRIRAGVGLDSDDDYVRRRWWRRIASRTVTVLVLRH